MVHLSVLKEREVNAADILRVNRKIGDGVYQSRIKNILSLNDPIRRHQTLNTYNYRGIRAGGMRHKRSGKSVGSLEHNRLMARCAIDVNKSYYPEIVSTTPR